MRTYTRVFTFQNAKQLFECLLTPFFGLQFTFPNYNHTPPFGLKFLFHTLISCSIAINFRLPKFYIRFWESVILAVFMTMPKTSMNEYDCLVFAKNDIWFARQILIVQSIAKSMRVQITAHKHFRLSVVTPDSGHIAAALFWCFNIGHIQSLRR